MKNNGRQRFYLWDYLWWMGEKLKQARRTGRVDGEMMLSIYIFALLIFPMMTVTIRLFPGVSALCTNENELPDDSIRERVRKMYV